jgi:hypothetical protein
MNLGLCTRMMTFSAARVGHVNKLQGLRVTASRMQPREGFKREALPIHPIQPPKPNSPANRRANA